MKRKDGSFKDCYNYITSAPSIAGPWSDPIFANASGFDPSLFHDDDGRKWFVNMLWDHRQRPHYFTGIGLQEFSPSESKLVGPRKNIFTGTDSKLVEGPHLYRRGGWYYLLTAEGGTAYEHACTLARSRDIWGPYETHPQKHILTSKDAPFAALQEPATAISWTLPKARRTWFTWPGGRPARSDAVFWGARLHPRSVLG